MKTGLVCILILASFILHSYSALSQESVNAAGGDASGTGGSSSFTVGELVYTTVSDENVIVAQGVQHAYEIFAVSVEEFHNNFQITIAPNPAFDVINLTTYKIGEFQSKLYDINGKILNSVELRDNEITIDISDLPASVYILKISSKNETIHSCKIIKSK